MRTIDWLILIFYLLGTFLLGFILAGRNKSQNDYFLAGRGLSGWIAGASMAATTFSIDTPLYVAGIVGNRGMAANWEWWSFGLAHVAMAVVFAPLWRRTEVITDAAFTELRYGGPHAAWLRGVKAFLLAVPINCIGIGYAFLAMRKVAEALNVVDGHIVFAGISDTFFLLLIVASFMLFYTILGGLWAVVVTDMIQLILALIGALAVAYVTINAAGGMSELLVKIDALDRPDLLSIFPWTWDKYRPNWISGAGISISTFIAFISLQWWSFRRSDGGGEFIQRMLATRDENQAKIAGWVFLVINYLIRSWLWIVVALSALVLLPEQTDWELSYPILAVKYLPPVALGFVVVSLLAAFMSTVSTSVNWGAGYLTHDLYQRFLRKSAGEKELLLVGKVASACLMLLGIITALVSDSIGSVFRLVIAIGTGPGVVLVMRWFWWRINAAAELAAMLIGFLIGLTTSLIPSLRIEDYGYRLFFTTLVTAIAWLIVLILTPPESEEVLERFVVKVRPPGPGWKDLRKRFGVKEEENLNSLIYVFFLSSALLFGALLGIGSFLLHQERGGWLFLSIAVFAFGALNKGRLRNII